MSCFNAFLNVKIQKSNNPTESWLLGATATSGFSQSRALPRLTPPNKSALWKKMLLSYRSGRGSDSSGWGGATVIRPHIWINGVTPSGGCAAIGCERGNFLSGAKAWGSSTAAANAEFPQLAPRRARRSWLTLADTYSGAFLG